MAIDFNGILDTIFKAIHSVTFGLRTFINNRAPDLLYIILLGLAIGGGYYLNMKYPNIIQKYGVVWISIMFYLLLRFV